MPWDVAVIGAGAAGLLAAIRAAGRGRQTLLLEKNRKPGVKILMSGGTRCNLTHATDARGIVEGFGPQGRFLHSALAAFGPEDLVALVEAGGVQTKVETTGKIFPVSNKAVDVLAAFTKRLQRSGATMALEEPLRNFERTAGGFRLATARRTVEVSKVVLTTGGQSYPGSGTTGDGYAWARQFGHTIVPPRPALVPLTTDAAWVKSLQGVTIPDVLVRVVDAAGKVLEARRGSFLFAHFGLSGPAVLDVSRVVSAGESVGLCLSCDFLPSLRDLELEEHLRRESVNSGKKLLLSVLPEALPRRLAEALLAQAGLAVDRKAAALGRDERHRLVLAIKEQAIPLTGTMGFKKAEVTAGGVSLAEVDSRTMQSKLVSGLFLAGEILDLDGWIGGYNFQAAFSTGWLAGSSV